MGCSASTSGTVATQHNAKVSSTKSKNVPVTADKKQTKSTEVDHGNQKEQYYYKEIDEHAKKAPDSAKNSAQELVNYMATVTKDPRMLARGFFVWSSENIKYDAEGYFGRAPKAPNDAESVLKNGRSVCEGYARVFELLCRKADIPVKKISGFAKGYSYSADKSLTVSTSTNHAWNAVQLEGKWYLIDSTWGAGHVDRETNSFKKKFDDFYFLTDPTQFISAHFPYMDNNLEESQKWQLLSKPLTLEEFNRNVQYKPSAFKLGAQAVSHPHGYFETKNKLQMAFRSAGKEEIRFSARLMPKEGNRVKEKMNTAFGYLENGVYILLVQPPKPGTYELTIFGRYISDEKLDSNPQLMKYIIKCNEVKEKDFEYPMSYRNTDRERCILHEPLNGRLPANTEVKFRLSAPHLQHVRVNQDWLEKTETIFSGEVKTCEAGNQVRISGTRGEKYGTYTVLYTFNTV